MEPATHNASAKIVGALIIGLLVGFAAGVFWQERRSGGATRDDTADGNPLAETGKIAAPAATSTSSVAMTGGFPVGNLVVNDQPASVRVGIASFDAKETLWVVVREEKNGALGNILGAQKVSAGDKQAAVVELLRPTIAGGIYRVVFYRDVGDPAFNYREDVIIGGVEGKFMAR